MLVNKFLVYICLENSPVLVLAVSLKREYIGRLFGIFISFDWANLKDAIIS